MASIADVQALDDLLAGLDDLTRASIERAIAHEVESEVESETGGMIDPDAHDLVVMERDNLRVRLDAVMLEAHKAVSRNVVLEQELAEKDRLIADLQRQLSERGKAA